MGVYLDTSFLIPLLLEHRNTRHAQEIFADLGGPLYISPSVIDETIYIGCRLILRYQYITTTSQMKEYILKNGYSFAKLFFAALLDLSLDLTNIPDCTDIVHILKNARTFHHLAGDAIILSTCQNHHIRTIATFDSDFLRATGITLVPDPAQGKKSSIN
jgi:predicted nucleic acid-binding protein